MVILRPAITGPIMGGMVVAVSGETTVLLSGTGSIRGEVFLLTLSSCLCSVFAHLSAIVVQHFREGIVAVVDERCAEFSQRLDDFEARLDAYEANGLNTLIDRAPEVPQQPGHLKRVR